jgi:hypothetical protein
LCLFWAAPETRERLAQLSGDACYDLREIVGPVEGWERRANALTEAVCQAGPRYRGLYWRAYLTEGLYRECLRLLALLDAVGMAARICQEAGQNEVPIEYVLAPDLARALDLAAAGQAVISPRPHASLRGGAASQPRGRLSRQGRRIREILTVGNWQAQAMNLLDEIDRDYTVRSRLGRLAPPRLEPGGVAFFSSYVNNSRTLHDFVPLMPLPITWIATNYSAAQAARETGQRVYQLWRCGPPRVETEADTAHEEHAPLLGSSDPVHQVASRWLADHPLWHNWVRRWFPMLRHRTGCWDAFLSAANPRLIVMANQWGIEGWFMDLARQRGIPILQIMHGIVSGHLHTQTPVRSDALVVWGELWRSLWPERERARILVYNPRTPTRVAAHRTSRQKPQITFFSWPLDQVAFHNQQELLGGMIDVLHTLLQQGWCDVAVRFHPLENPDSFLRQWRDRHGPVPEALVLGKHDPLAQVLARTDVALMFRSTVMLDCLASHIPVVMPGWLDSGWGGSFAQLPGVYLAHDYSDLLAQLVDWLRQSAGSLRQPAGLHEGGLQDLLLPGGQNRDSLVSLIMGLLDGEPIGRSGQPSGQAGG